MQMGTFAGRTIAAEVTAAGRDRPRPVRGTFIYRDRGSMATIGRGRAVADIKGWHFGGWLAFMLWGAIHILFLVDFRQRFLAMLEWIWMYVFYERGVRLITGQTSPRPVRPPDDPHLVSAEDGR